MGDLPEVRAGDGDRNEALDRLGAFFAGGYLSVEEFDERSGKAAVAVTRAQLDELFLDLPDTPPTNGELTSRIDDEDAAAQRELDELLAKKRRANYAYAVLWGVTIVLFIVGGVLLHVGWMWLVFPLAGGLSGGVRRTFGISEAEEEVADELEKKLKDSRVERLHKAAERRRELGQ